MTTIPSDYLERVYAGVLGKIIGVYLGRPIEGWGYDALTERFGQIDGYVHEQLERPLIVTDDDISGTFTFLRALEDYDAGADVEPWQIGQTWLNYIIERRTVLWWGGVGVSTEHTAFMRLKRGVTAPRSGSTELNSQTVAEQIGAQIFIDGWAMVAPGDPGLAAELAKRAGSVSHDGAAVHAAQVVAAMEALAFIEQDIHLLLDCAICLIPSGSIIRKLIDDVRSWHADDPVDWRGAFLKVRAKYGYDSYGGGCHVVPNHALIILALLYGNGDFSHSLMIVNTCGWDTDCNSGNLGCLLGIRNGTGGIDASSYDWRSPVADRMYQSTADGGRCITDAAAEAIRIANFGLSIAGKAALAPKGGARFHFDLPGALQGWVVNFGKARLENVAGHSSVGERALAIHMSAGQDPTVRVGTPTFTPPSDLGKASYELIACPTLYPGQMVNARVAADPGNTTGIEVRLMIEHYDDADTLSIARGPAVRLSTDSPSDLVWSVPDVGGQPIARVGLELTASKSTASATAYLDTLTWTGVPNYSAGRVGDGTVWPSAWVNATDEFEPRSGAGGMRIVQNDGTGLLIHGTREWTDYRVSAAIKCHFAESCGLAARVQGLKRYYALLLVRGDRVRLVKELDGATVLSEVHFAWSFDRTYDLSLVVDGPRVRAAIDGDVVIDHVDQSRPLVGGAIAAVVEGGNANIGAVRVSSASGK